MGGVGVLGGEGDDGRRGHTGQGGHHTAKNHKKWEHMVSVQLLGNKAEEMKYQKRRGRREGGE